MDYRAQIQATEFPIFITAVIFPAFAIKTSIYPLGAFHGTIRNITRAHDALRSGSIAPSCGSMEVVDYEVHNVDLCASVVSTQPKPHPCLAMQF